MKERTLVTSHIKALDPRLRTRMRAYRADNPGVGMVAVFRRSKTEVETIRAAFGRHSRANSCGVDYSAARLFPKQGGRRNVNLFDTMVEWDGEGTESDSCPSRNPARETEVGIRRRWRCITAEASPARR